MTSLVFSDNKEQCFKGLPATHWTHENMKHCSYITGNFNTDITKAAKEVFMCSFTNYYGEQDNYIDGESLLSGQDVPIKVWGLVQEGSKYFWNGEIKTVTFKLDVSIE